MTFAKVNYENSQRAQMTIGIKLQAKKEKKTITLKPQKSQSLASKRIYFIFMLYFGYSFNVLSS